MGSDRGIAVEIDGMLSDLKRHSLSEGVHLKVGTDFNGWVGVTVIKASRKCL